MFMRSEFEEFLDDYHREEREKSRKMKRKNPPTTKSNKSKKAKIGVTTKEKKLLKELAARELKYCEAIRSGATPDVAQVSDTGTPTNTAVLTPSAGSVTQIILNYVPIGDTNFQRTGKKILMKKILVKGYLNYIGEGNSVTFTRPNPIRLVLLMDKTANDFFGTTDEERPFSEGGFMAMQNPNTFGKYKILKDMIVMPPVSEGAYESLGGTVATYQGGFVPFKMSVKWPSGIPVTYNNFGAGGSPGDIRSLNDNAIYLIAWQRDTNEVECRVNYRSRVTFSDL